MCACRNGEFREIRAGDLGGKGYGADGYCATVSKSDQVKKKKNGLRREAACAAALTF